MGEAGEGAPKQEDSFLSRPPEARLKAVLVTAEEPITRQMVLNYSGINSDQIAKMNEAQRKVIDQVFADPRLKREQIANKGETEAEDVFSYSEEHSKELQNEIKESGIELADAQLQVGRHIMNQLRGRS